MPEAVLQITKRPGIFFFQLKKENCYLGAVESSLSDAWRVPKFLKVHQNRCGSYYPFGLTMAGISSNAAGGIQNKYKFNGGTELNTTFDINLYETAFRGLDPQIGRFHQIDPLAFITDGYSPYSFALDNPIFFNDPLGLLAGADSTKPKPGSTPETAIPMPEVVVTARGHKKAVSPSLEPKGQVPYSEIVKVLTDKNSESYEKLIELQKTRSFVATEMRAADAARLKNILSGALLTAIDIGFTAFDFANGLLSVTKQGSSPLEIPVISGLTSPIVNNLVKQTDHDLFEDLIKTRGYQGALAFMGSAAGRRNPMMGVYASKEVMLQIINAGYLDLRMKNLILNPTGPLAKDTYFIFFPGTKDQVIKQFMVLPLTK